MQQNFFDISEVFDGYQKLRGNDDNCNVLMEQPEMAQLLPDVRGKAVLDLGCGCGHNCAQFSDSGAARIVGIDISQKMLAIAQSESYRPNIEYKNLCMTEISALSGKFDLVYSSLAFHYIEDFDRLMRDIAGLMNKGGTLLFSQEHPIYTASENGQGHYILDEQGTKCGYCFSHYQVSGKREDEWFVKGRVYYHRRFCDIANALINAGFCIKSVREPVPSAEMTAKRPRSDTLHKPLFLIIKAEKL